jgi:hypothetical protein
MDNTFDISSMYDEQVSEGLVAEATAFKTLPTGLYKGIVSKVEGKIVPPVRQNGDPNPDAGRNLAHCTVDIYDAETGAKKGKQFIDIAVPTEIYRVNPETRTVTPEKDAERGWELDKSSKLLGQAYKALDIKGSLGDLLNGMKETYFGIFITESFVTTEGGKRVYKNARTEEERNEYVKAGFEAKNFVQSISKLK